MSTNGTFISQRTPSPSSANMSLKRLLNDVEDEVPYPRHSPVSCYGSVSVSGSSYQSLDDYSGSQPRQTQFLHGYPHETEVPVLEELDSLGHVFNNILSNYDPGDQLPGLNLVNEHEPYNLDFELEKWGHDLAMASPATSYTSQPSPSSRSASSPDSLLATNSPSLMPESSVTGSDSCSMASDDDAGKICYGMLHNVDVKLVPSDMTVIDTKLNAAHQASRTSGRTQQQRFTLIEQQEHVHVNFRDNTEFGYLRSGPGKTLSRLLKNPLVEFEPIAPIADLRETIGRARKAAEAMVKVDINIYGPRSAAQDVGDKLSEGKLWLQKPAHSRKEVEYDNPHLLQLEGAEELTIETAREVNGGGPAKRQPREENLRKMMMEVYDSLKRTRHLEKVDGSKGLRNPLLRHQQEALGFMLERESGNIDIGYRLWHPVKIEGEEWYRHRITNIKQRNRPDERGGGILADEMGMGKSLSILSLIVKTLDSGREWAERENESQERGKDLSYSGSTLVVVSSALLIYNWMDEVRKHVDGEMRSVEYHGPARTRDLNKIKNSHIVVTTYNTLSAEYERKSSILHKIGWYRVVLDEAHIIRRPATKFFKTCKALEANSRWCLTGTPIQNRLSDIGALFSFIRARPFDEPAKFRKYIEVPFEQNSENPQKVKERLIMLLEALCLRRTKELLELPGLEEVTRKLDFSPAEREQYDKTKKILMRTIMQKVGEVEKSSKFGLFQANLQMRILCNHGTFQKPFSWHRQTYRLDEREAVVSALGQNAEITCNGCHQPMPILGSSRLRNEFEEQCAHVFCSECLEDSDLSAAASGAQRRHCPGCDTLNKAQRVPLVRIEGPGTAGDVDMAEAPVQSTAEDDHYFNMTGSGFSTKMQALIQDVNEDLGQTKSIIFSCWTRTLRLVALHLEKAGIRFEKIDGNCSLEERKNVLKRFEKSNDKRVLIMTTGTGAFGLNLTCANRVFIVELQWNPSVENQAIARAIRLGQGQKVLVTRYVINDTVEVEMSSQQNVKKNLARIGFEYHDGDEMDESHD